MGARGFIGRLCVAWWSDDPCSYPGSVDIYNPAGTTHVIVDIFGWFTGEEQRPPS